jgi:prepilin-type N-terminal cleavage/methylation domain-containing protein
MWKQNKTPQSGFTLVELAIVLVIIGLILAAVLKGQEMVTNAKVKSVANDLKGISVAYYAYQDLYKTIPGDDAAAANHAGTGALAGNGDGLITGAYNDAATPPATESQYFWQHTRMAGFLTGTATAGSALPSNNSVGGILGVQGGTTAAAVYGMTGPVVCASNVPWKIAQAADTTLDDGDSTTGSVRAGAAGVTATATGTSAAYGPGVAIPSTEGLHTLCMKI